MSDGSLIIEKDIDFSGYEGEGPVDISIQGEELEDLSIAGTPLNIYELLILICQKGQKKVDERGAMTLFHKKGPYGTGSPGAAKYGTELKNNSIRLKIHAATAEITRQLLSTVTNRRVIYVPQHGGLHNHSTPKPGEIGTHAAGMAWDHGDYRKVSPPAAPTFFYTDNNSALTTRQLIAAVAVLCDQGILPEGRLGFYGTKHVINNMHYDYLLWSRKTENKNLFTKINNLNNSGGNASGWYWHNKIKIPTGWGANNLKKDNLLWIKKRRPKNKSIDEILSLYEQYSIALQDSEIITLQEYLDYLAERDASASPWVKMKKIS